jgi:hypothetical protein
MWPSTVTSGDEIGELSDGSAIDGHAAGSTLSTLS